MTTTANNERTKGTKKEGHLLRLERNKKWKQVPIPRNTTFNTKTSNRFQEIHRTMGKGQRGIRESHVKILASITKTNSCSVQIKNRQHTATNSDLVQTVKTREEEREQQKEEDQRNEKTQETPGHRQFPEECSKIRNIKRDPPLLDEENRKITH